jgi:hypothetical protein
LWVVGILDATPTSFEFIFRTKFRGICRLPTLGGNFVVIVEKFDMRIVPGKKPRTSIIVPATTVSDNSNSR